MGEDSLRSSRIAQWPHSRGRQQYTGFPCDSKAPTGPQGRDRTFQSPSAPAGSKRGPKQALTQARPAVRTGHAPRTLQSRRTRLRLRARWRMRQSACPTFRAIPHLAYRRYPGHKLAVRPKPSVRIWKGMWGGCSASWVPDPGGRDDGRRDLECKVWKPVDNRASPRRHSSSVWWCWQL